jgi:hypothetical protein
MLIDAVYSLLVTVNVNTYPCVTEQEVDPPFIVHTFAKTNPYPSKDGVSYLDTKILKVASYDITQRAAQTQADAIRVRLDEYSGILNSVEITKIRFIDEETGYEQDQDLYFTLQTYKIWINFNT